MKVIRLDCGNSAANYFYLMMMIFSPQTLCIGVYLVINTNFFRCDSFQLKAHAKVCLNAWCKFEI